MTASSLPPSHSRADNLLKSTPFLSLSLYLISLARHAFAVASYTTISILGRHTMSPGRAGMLLSCIPPHYHEAVFTSRHDDDDSTRSAALVPTTQSHFDPSVYPPPSWAATLPFDTPAPRRVVVPTMPSRQTSSPLPSPPSKSWPASVSPPQRSLTSTPHVVQIEDPDKSIRELDEKAELPFSSLENGGKVQPKRRNYAPIVIAAFVLLVFHSSRLVWSKYQEHNLSIDIGTSASSSAETFITSASATTLDEPRPQLPADWWHRCTKHLVVPAGMYTDRLDKLAATLKGGAWISEPGASVEYYLGAFGPGVWHPSERAFLVAVDSAGSVTILTPAFEEGRARLIPLPSDVVKRVTWLSWTESESPYTVLINHLGNKPQIVLEAGVRNFVVDGVHSAQKQRGMDPSLPAFDVGSAVASIRERKDEREIGLMRCANEATLHAIRKTRMQMYIGISESMTRKILYNEMSHVGLKDYSALVLFGPNAALPHGSGTDRTLGSDEFALIDAGGYWGGYIADITRVS